MSIELRRALEQVAARSRGVRLWGALALCWLAFALIGVGLAIVLARPGTERYAPGLLVGWLMTLAGAAFAVAGPILRSSFDPRRIARRIEARFPDLDTGLLAAVEQAASPEGPSYLQAAVIRQALDHRRKNDWAEAVVPSRKLGLAKFAHFASVVLLGLATLAMVVQGNRHNVIATRLLAENPALALEGGPEVQVEPGNVEIERGTPLLVVARFNGTVPADADLVVAEASGSTAKPMSRALEDPMFAGRIESVGADLSYRVRFARGESPSYTVKVFEYPEVRRADAKLVFPAYTSIETKIVEDIRHVTAVEGTELTLTFHLNKEVADAKLVDEKGAVTPLAKVESADSHLYASTFTLADSHKYKVDLVDKDGRKSKVPAEIAVNVTRNKPATVVVTQPSRDVQVSPVEELTLRANVG